VFGESVMSPGLMNTAIITGIFFCAMRLSTFAFAWSRAAM